MAGIEQATYKVEALATKNVGAADTSPLWNASNWTTGGGYIDISPYVDLEEGVTINRGAILPLENIAAGTATIPFRADGGALSTLSDSIGVRITATYASTTYPLYLGFLENMRRIPGRVPKGVINLTDLLDNLEHSRNATPPLLASPSSAQLIAAYLDMFPWAYRRLDTGISPVQGADGAYSTMGESGLTQSGVQAGQSILNMIQQVVQANMGRFFIAKDGYAVFLGSGGENPGGIKATITNVMTRPVFEIDRSKVINYAVAVRTAAQAPNQISQNTTSIQKRGRRAWNMQSQVWKTDGQAASAAGHAAGAYATGVNRVRTVDLDARDSTLMTAMLNIDIGDRVKIEEGWDGTSAQYLVIGITHTIGKRHAATWTLCAPGM